MEPFTQELPMILPEDSMSIRTMLMNHLRKGIKSTHWFILKNMSALMKLFGGRNALKSGEENGS